MLKSNFCLSVKHIIKLTNANRSHRSTLELLVISDFQGASHLSSIQQAPCEGSITVPANGFWDHCIMALRAGLIASANQSTPMLPRTICLLDAIPSSKMSIVFNWGLCTLPGLQQKVLFRLGCQQLYRCFLHFLNSQSFQVSNWNCYLGDHHILDCFFCAETQISWTIN